MRSSICFRSGVETLLFYHPAVWWLGKRVRAEREHCCDDAAVALCGSPVTYAHALTRMAESKAAPQLAMAANRSPLVERIARLLGANRGSGIVSRSEFVGGRAVLVGGASGRKRAARECSSCAGADARSGSCSSGGSSRSGDATVAPSPAPVPTHVLWRQRQPHRHRSSSCGIAGNAGECGARQSGGCCEDSAPAPASAGRGRNAKSDDDGRPRMAWSFATVQAEAALAEASSQASNTSAMRRSKVTSIR